MNGPTEPPEPASEPPARRRRWQTANFVVSVVLCGGAVAFGGYAALLTLVLPMLTATCGPGECNTAVVEAAVLSGLAGIALILIAMCVLVVRSLIRRRRAVWWPLLAVAAIAGLWILCLAVVSAAAGS